MIIEFDMANCAVVADENNADHAADVHAFPVSAARLMSIDDALALEPTSIRMPLDLANADITLFLARQN